MELIVRRPRHYHVSHDTVEELEAAILDDPRVVPATLNKVAELAIDTVTRIARRTGADAGALLRAGRRSAVSAESRRDYMAVMMGLDPVRCAPWFALPSRRSVYLFDAWPATHAAIARFVESWGVQYAFVSSSQAAQRLAAACDRCTFIWVPEGIDPSRYVQRSYLEKDIDVLQIGRKYDGHHVEIVDALQKSGKSYLYEQKKGEIIFPDRRDFVDALSRARISICVPSSVTHPARAGDIETMTVRYLQSMVSRSVVLGRAPEEMIELFGYNPVIDIDMSDPAGQILSILDSFDDYVPLIERNFDLVTSQHTWDKRWERMSAVLFPA